VTDVVETKLGKKMVQIRKARLMLDWLEKNPELISDGMQITSHIFLYPPSNLDDDAKRAWVLENMRPYVNSLKHDAPIGDVKKIDSDYYYGFERKFGNGLTVSVNAHNAGVCEYVETDEMEEVTIVPDEIVAQYQTTVMRPKTVRICPRLFSEGD